MTRPWAQWLALLVAIGVGFGAVVPDFYMAADDLFATALMHDLDQGGSAGLFDKLYGVVFRAEGLGHFRRRCATSLPRASSLPS